MPLSRRRKRRPRRSRARIVALSQEAGRIRLESIFDKGNASGAGLKGPRVLYHYTSWEAAEAIVSTQRFRATAHDCTNDEMELVAADGVIMEEARKAMSLAHSPMLQRSLGLFVSKYEDSRVSAARRTYFASFSTERDDPGQWCNYGLRGSGVCLGLRLLEIEQPVIAGVSTAYMPVTYGEVELREKVAAWFARLASDCEGALDIEENWQLTLDALNVTAAAWALTTKTERWASEKEIRAIFFARDGHRVVPVEEDREDGSVRRYVDLPVTARKRMPIQEVIVGPQQGLDAGFARVLRMLSRAGYRHPERKAVASMSSPQCF